MPCHVVDLTQNLFAQPIARRLVSWASPLLITIYRRDPWYSFPQPLSVSLSRHHAEVPLSTIRNQNANT